MTPSDIFERGTFCGTKILQIRRSVAVACVLAHSHDFAIKRGLTPPQKGEALSQRWSRGHKARGQGHKKTSEAKAKAKNSLFEDKHSRGQGQECSRPRPRTQAQVLSKKKKRSSQKFFKRSPQKNVFQKIFQALHKILTIQKNSAVLEPRTGQFLRT